MTTDATTGGEIPGPLEELLSGRDRSPLADDTFLRYQYIGLTAAIAANRRLELHHDGSVHGAVNVAAPPDAQERFNVALPAEPTATISEAELAAVKDALEEVGFYESPVYVAVEGVRDGGATIVTVAGDDGVHEVWYVNVDNELTNLLWSLLDEPTAENADSAQVLADLERIRDELA